MSNIECRITNTEVKKAPPVLSALCLRYSTFVIRYSRFALTLLRSKSEGTWNWTSLPGTMNLILAAVEKAGEEE